MKDRRLRILLIGMVGAGKTSVGRVLAARTGWPLVDNDELVRELTGRAPAAIARTDGTAALHAAEATALSGALVRPGPAILPVAGSVIDREDLRPSLRRAGHVVWLRARPDTLRSRIGGGEGRLPEAVDPAWLVERATAREPLFAAVAHQVVDVDDRSVDEVAAAILAEVAAIRAASVGE